MAQFNLVQGSTAPASFTGVNISLVTIQGSGAVGGLLNLSGYLPQALRGFQITSSGGYARLETQLRSLDIVLVSQLGEKQKVSGNKGERGLFEPVLKKLVVRGKFVCFNRFNNPVTVIRYSRPDDLHNVTLRILAVSALWVEIIGSNGIGDFITECVKHVVHVSDELQQELTRICTNLAEDLVKSGLGLLHEDTELSKIIGDDVKPKLKDSGLMQATKCELVDLLWTLHIDEYKTGGMYSTNDVLVFYIYTCLTSVFTPFPLRLDYYPSKSRFQLEKTLPVYRNCDGFFADQDPWLVPCTFDDSWELMYLHNRPFLGQNSIGQFVYEEKVRSMLEKLMEYTTVSPIVTDDKGLCSQVQFDAASVPIGDALLHRETERACLSVLPSEFSRFALVAASLEFFTKEELREAEAPRNSSEGPITIHRRWQFRSKRDFAQKKSEFQAESNEQGFN